MLKIIGSISQKVMTESEWPVRVARGKIEVDPLPVRIIIGYNGTPGTDAAVATVAARQWREHSKARLVTAIVSLVPTAIGRFVSPVVN